MNAAPLTPIIEIARPDSPRPEIETEDLLREIAEDARRESARYLDDSKVPEGGE